MITEVRGGEGRVASKTDTQQRLNKGGRSSWNGYRPGEAYILPDLCGSNCVVHKGT